MQVLRVVAKEPVPAGRCRVFGSRSLRDGNRQRMLIIAWP
jgi:hypothetical protein